MGGETHTESSNKIDLEDDNGSKASDFISVYDCLFKSSSDPLGSLSPTSPQDTEFSCNLSLQYE